METPRNERGVVLAIVALLAALLAAALFAVEMGIAGGAAQRERVSERALAQAREALVAYAVDRPVNSAVGPGYLPCPDLDDDGWAESTCGSQSGDSGQAQRLGRLPWKTLGLPDLRDGYGERLWYAVSSKYKGLLNCAVSRACLDMSPAAALGTITVRDATGAVIHDGTNEAPERAAQGGALAVVIAPGPALERAGSWQARECGPGDCDASGRCITDPPQLAARCNPVNYLDQAAEARFAFEDNADFLDRNDTAGRARNGNGFIMGPVVLSDGRLAVNDRIAVISYRDVMPRLMARVGLEVAACLRFYASRAENGGRFPWPAPACAQRSGSWAATAGVFFGRIPDTPFTAMAAQGHLDRWWRASPAGDLAQLPTADDACRIAVAPDDPGPQRASPPPAPADEGTTAGLASNAWWTPWKPYVFYALSQAFSAASTDSQCSASRCIVVSDAAGVPAGSPRAFAVIVAGAPLSRDGFVQHRDGASISDVTMWLEESNATLEGAAGCPADPPQFPCEAAGTCARVTSAATTAAFNDVVVASP